MTALRVGSGRSRIAAPALTPPIIPVTPPAHVVFWLASAFISLAVGILVTRSAWPRRLLLGVGWLLFLLALILALPPVGTCSVFSAPWCSPSPSSRYSRDKSVVTAATESGQLAGSGGDVAELGALRTLLIGRFAFAVSNVLAATVISVYKPWGMTQRGRRETRRRARTSRTRRTVRL